jgi:hypothetical protein
VVHGTIHGPGYFHQQGIGRSCSLSCRANFATDFHDFAIDWEPERIAWYVDGEQYFEVKPEQLGTAQQWVFDHHFSLVLNLAVGGTWPGYPLPETMFPQQLLVDYVRVYQREGQENLIMLHEASASPQRKDAISVSENSNIQVRGSFLHRMVAKNGMGAEIGVHKGQFTRSILDHTQPMRLHLIDPWYLFGKEWPWAKDNKSTTDALVGVLQSFEEELVNGSVVLHVGYDLEVLAEFTDQYFDWVYLDTSHQYEQTQRELLLLKRKVKADGVITGDDWYADPNHLHHGVFRAVQEFLAHEPYELIYADDIDKQWAIRQVQI